MVARAGVFTASSRVFSPWGVQAVPGAPERGAVGRRAPGVDGSDPGGLQRCPPHVVNDYEGDGPGVERRGGRRTPALVIQLVADPSPRLEKWQSGPSHRADGSLHRGAGMVPGGGGCAAAKPDSDPVRAGTGSALRSSAAIVIAYPDGGVGRNRRTAVAGEVVSPSRRASAAIRAASRAAGRHAPDTGTSTGSSMWAGREGVHAALANRSGS